MVDAFVGGQALSEAGFETAPIQLLALGLLMVKLFAMAVTSLYALIAHVNVPRLTHALTPIGQRMWS